MLEELFLYWFLPVAGYFIFKYLYGIHKERTGKRLLETLETPKDVAIIHTFPPTSLPTVTGIPWEVKLELFFRHNGIQYKKDTKVPFYPSTGKTPWVSYNGSHVGDSQLIIEYFRKKHDVQIRSRYSSFELASARAIRVMLEERWYWSMTNWRFIRSDGYQQCQRDFAETVKYIWPMPLWLLRLYWGRALKDENYKHGIGRHQPKDRERFFLDDLKTVSDFLGGKKFILGDELCEEDLGIFGQLTMAVWGLPGSPDEKFINEKAPNLKSYCERIKALYWPHGWVPSKDYNNF